MKNYLLRLSLVAAGAALSVLSSCAPAPKATVVATPPKAAAVAPTATKIRKEISAIQDSNKMAQRSLAKAVEESTRLAEQKAATIAELESLSILVKEAQATVDSQALQLAEAQVTAEILNEKVAAADAENSALRTTLGEANRRLEEAEKFEAYAAPKVAVYKWISSRLFWLALIAAVCIILFVLVRFSANIRGALSP